MANELVVLDNERIENALTTPGAIDLILKEVHDLADAWEEQNDLDIQNDKDRKEIASFAYKIARTKTTIDNYGKELVSGVKAKIKAIDSARKRARDELDQIKDGIRKPLTEWEEKNAKLLLIIDNLDAMPSSFMPGAMSVQIKNKIESCHEYDDLLSDGSIDPEMQEKLEASYKGAIETMTQMFLEAEKREAEQAELEQLRKEKEEREATEKASQLPEDSSEPPAIPEEGSSPQSAAQPTTNDSGKGNPEPPSMTDEAIEDLQKIGVPALLAYNIIDAIVNGRIRNVVIRRAKF